MELAEYPVAWQTSRILRDHLLLQTTAMCPEKIGIAMSGGVDSTVTALLLREQGYEVHGFFMRLPVAESEKQIQRVQEIAEAIDIDLELIDMREQFSEKIIRYFTKQYRQGKTPNPCVVCNKTIKFGVLLETMLSRGMDKGATGHYARINHDPDRGYHLLRGLDPKKDQSYFLCRLDQKQLARILFPLGSWHKQDVYAKAESLGLTGFSGNESQDVCFLSTGLQEFLTRQGVGEKTGEICSLDGRLLGHHSGISHYTVGQRRGLGLPDATPWYVVGLDPKNNRILIGKNEELFKQEIVICDLQWTSPNLSLPWQGLVQLRSRHQPARARLQQTAENRWLIRCTELQRAITPGQFAVFYEDERVVGSGTITAAETPGS